MDPAEARRAHGAVKEDLRSEEGVVFVEVSLVKHKQELDTIVQSLNRVGNTALEEVSMMQSLTSGVDQLDLRWKEPDIACCQIVHKRLSVFVNSLDIPVSLAPDRLQEQPSPEFDTSH